jgi:hypothetical protein
MAGLKALLAWGRAHWVWALIIVGVVIPFALLPVFAIIKAKVATLPGVGSIASKIPSIGA